MALLQSSDFFHSRKLLLLLPVFFIHLDLSHGFWVNDSDFSTPEQCRRKCVAGGDPLICSFDFTLEYYTTIGPACNRTDQLNECIVADGVEKTILPINRQLPGPLIEVCKGDIIKVDVKNAAPGMEATIHWHGIFQYGYQFYDGVPFVTQCPIPSSTSFRYLFGANNAGTHFYHSHVMTHMLDGQQGALIVHDPEDPYLNSYNWEYVMHLSDWMHELSLERFPGRYHTNIGQAAENILINGRGNWKDPKNATVNTHAPLWTFNVQQNDAIRFRIINSFSTVCPAEIAFHKHRCTVIAQDGALVKSKVVDKVVILTGERVDCIINTNQALDSYWIQVRGLGECAETERKVQQLAILRYQGASATPSAPQPEYDSMPNGVTYNGMNATKCNTNDTSSVVCVNQLESYEDAEPEIMEVEPTVRFVMPFYFYNYTQNDDKKLFGVDNKFPAFFDAADRSQLISSFNNKSYETSSSTLLTDRRSLETVCKPNVLSTCTQPCTCTQVLHVVLGSLVELVIYDQYSLAGLDHPFHLHGYEFKVFSIGKLTGNISRDDIEVVIKEHTARLQRGEYKNPPGKDTVKIPEGGYAIVRFLANNPGFWLIHCHFSWHHVTGMELVIQVGEREDLPPTPSGFPECSNWKPAVHLMRDFFNTGVPYAY
ncbi:uncharacterized protein LOC117229350 [Megalopta genalis]|uniref:uncharacterized protein LOC117229350 n=1 Tax=Megalopta genalis TaxID=115081 RepID=UPI003FCEF7F5